MFPPSRPTVEPQHRLESSQGFQENRPLRVKGLRVQINSQHTGSAAESYFADLVFRNKAQ